MIVRVPLSHGIWRDGVPFVDVELRELSGADEESLASLPEEVPVAARVSDLLARTIIRIGDLEPVTAAETGELTVGDRERILLQLYADNFARKLKLHADCEHCGEQIDAQIAIADLLVVPDSDLRAEYELGTDAGWSRFRLPQGADQEAAVRFAEADIEGACNLLIERCILETAGEFDFAALRQPLEERFAELDPQAETAVQLICPSCASTTEIIVDAATLVLERLAPATRLLDEVDSIARSYHWSERDILALPTARRRAYLERIDEGAWVG